MRIGPDFEKIREVHSRIEQIREKVGERTEQKREALSKSCATSKAIRGI